MDKIIDLGTEIEHTGETRVSLIDDSLLKTASNAIQEHWASMDRDPNKAYLHVLAMTNSEKYGPNNNGDFFKGDDLRNDHKNFLKTAHVYLHHVNKDPKKSLGKPIYSFYNENMERVELILELDKNSSFAADTVRKIKDGEQIYVSMGVSVQYDVCSICGNKAKSRQQYCEHLRYNMNRIMPDGRQVYAINPSPLKFFDISIVARPADRIAWALDKAASQDFQYNCFAEMAKTSAELGEDATDYRRSLEGLDKLSELIKKIDGDIVEMQDGKEDSINVLRRMRELGLKHLDYPTLDFEEMEDMDVSPGCLIRGIVGAGVPPSLSELAYASGKHHMGKGFGRHHLPHMMNTLPGAIRLMRMQPEKIIPAATEILGDYDNELEDVGVLKRILGSVSPVAKQRIIIIKEVCDGSDELAELQKTAGEVLDTMPEPPKPINHLNLTSDSLRDSAMRNMLSNRVETEMTTKGPGMSEEYTVTGKDGTLYKTNRRSVIAAQNTRDSATAPIRAVGATMGLAALGALLSEPSMALKMLSIPTGIAAYKMLNYSPGNTIKTLEGVEIPSNSAFSSAVSEVTNEAGMRKSASSMKDALIPAAFMSVPAALGLDYLANKHIKYKDDPYAEQHMSGVQRGVHRTGEEVVNSPFTTMATAGLAGAALNKHLNLKSLARAAGKAT